MGKIFQTEASIVEMVEERFSLTSLSEVGVNLTVMSVTKQKDVIKVTKANDATEFLIQKPGTVQVFIYEEVFKNLDFDTQVYLIDFALSNVSFNSEKDKLIVDGNPYNALFKARKRIGDKADEMLEASYLAIQQFEDKSNE